MTPGEVYLGLSDKELVHRFTLAFDEGAFQVLLRRHGAMVFDVCRTILGNEDEAEDAFQATFVLFVKKAGTIRKTASVGSWLYGVAYRTSLKARALAAQRRTRRAQTPVVEQVMSADQVTWREVRELVHVELNRCAQRLRDPLVLCYLQGNTQEEAAGILGISRAALKKRLERGKALLRMRLSRAGIGPEALLMTAIWPGDRALRPLLLAKTAEAATRPLAASVISENVAAITNSMLTAIFCGKVGVAATVALLATAPLVGAFAYYWSPHVASANVSPSTPVAGRRHSTPFAVAGLLGQMENTPSPTVTKSMAETGDMDGDLARLAGVWINSDNVRAGNIELTFARDKSLVIRWTPLPTHRDPRPVDRIAGARYALQKSSGRHLLVIQTAEKNFIHIPCRIDGDALNLDGGVFEEGEEPIHMQVNLNGQWRPVRPFK
jgi:RNA polymerase sigma factor (sigma-70 family)